MVLHLQLYSQVQCLLCMTFKLNVEAHFLLTSIAVGTLQLGKNWS